MIIPDEQFDAEVFPLAYQLTICLICGNLPSPKYSLENCPDKIQRKLIAEMVSETVQMLGGNLQAFRVGKKKIELIIDAPINVEKIFNLTTLGIIEILRKSNQFSNRINLWEPEKQIKSIANLYELEKKIRSVSGEKEIALRKIA